MQPELAAARAMHVTPSDAAVVVELTDGRRVSVPLKWYPRLVDGSPEERGNWRFIGRGEGIHWPDLDDDMSVANLLAGKPSGESQPLLKRWLEKRRGAA